MFLCAKKRGNTLLRYFLRVGPRGMKERPSRSVDGARIDLVQVNEVLMQASRVVRIVVEKSSPSPADADDLHPLVLGAVDDCFNAWIKTRDVSAAGKYCDVHVRSSSSKLVLPSVATIGPIELTQNSN